MSVNQWLEQFRAMHTRARAGGLKDFEKQEYLAAREQFARALMNAQGLTVDPGASARRSFSVAQGLQVDLTLTTGNLRAMTIDVSCGGFSTLLHKAPPEREAIGFSLRMPGGAAPLIGRVTVLSVTRRVGNVRVTFAFQELPSQELERLELALFDIALERIKTK